MSGPQNPLAFPVATTSHIHSEGMTLRDWFAGQALAGLCANAAYLDLLPKVSPASEKALAEVALSIADATLAARNKEPDA